MWKGDLLYVKDLVALRRLADAARQTGFRYEWYYHHRPLKSDDLLITRIRQHEDDTYGYNFIVQATQPAALLWLQVNFT